MASKTYFLEDCDRLVCIPCSFDGKSKFAHGFCDTCKHHLCESCFKGHCVPLICRDHVMLDQVSMPKEKVVRRDPLTERCEKHGSLLKYYCKKHKDILCCDCVTLIHVNCGVSLIPDEIEVFRNSQEIFSLHVSILELIERMEKNKETEDEDIVRGLGLVYTSDGLRSFIDYECKHFHSSLLKDLQLKKCSECSSDNLLPDHSPSKCPSRSGSCICRQKSSNRRPCPNDVCGKLYEGIIVAHRQKQPNFRNTNISLWTTDYWEVAKAFLPGGYRLIRSVKEADLVALLNIGINLTCITERHNIRTTVLEQCRNARNAILHNASQKVSDAEKDSFIQIMIDVLTCAPVLQKDPAAQAAVVKLQELTVYEQDITLIKHWRFLNIDTGSDYYSEVEDSLGFKRELKNFENDWILMLDETDDNQERMIDSLLGKKNFPQKEQLSVILQRIGKNRSRLNKIMEGVSKHIHSLSGNILKVIPCYKHDTETDKPDDTETIEVVFLVIYEGQIDSAVKEELKSLNTYCRIKNCVSEERRSVFLQKEYREETLTKKEEEKLKQTIARESNKLFKKHSNLTIISPSNIKSVGFRFGGKEHKMLNETCIVLCVPVKGLIPLFEEPFKAMIGDYQTDVMEGTFSFFGQTSKTLHSNIKTGCQITCGHLTDNTLTEGTVGPFIKLPNGNVGFITSAHLVCNLNKIVFEKKWNCKLSKFESTCLSTRPINRQSSNWKCEADTC